MILYPLELMRVEKNENWNELTFVKLKGDFWNNIPSDFIPFEIDEGGKNEKLQWINLCKMDIRVILTVIFWIKN